MIGRLVGLYLIGSALVGTPVAAQTSRVEFTGVYAIGRADSRSTMGGWATDAAVTVGDGWSLLAALGAIGRSGDDVDTGSSVRVTLRTFGAGARWSKPPGAAIRPFVHLVVGIERAAAKTDILGTRRGDTEANLMLQPGAGIRIGLSRWLAIVGQLDYRRVFLDEAVHFTSGRNEVHLGVGARISAW